MIGNSPPDGTDKRGSITGQPIVFANESCMPFTFADFEPRRLTLVY